MTSPFNDSELIQIDQPDDLNDSGFDGPWNQDFESTTYLPIFPYQKQICHFVMENTTIDFKIVAIFKLHAFLYSRVRNKRTPLNKHSPWNIW